MVIFTLSPCLRNEFYNKIEPQHEISNNVICATSKCSDQPALARSLVRAFASRLNIRAMSVKLLTEHHLELLSLNGCCTGSSESTYVKMPHCWKSHVAAQIFYEEVRAQPLLAHKNILPIAVSI